MRGKGALRVTFGSTNNSSNRPADQRTSVAPNHPGRRAIQKQQKEGNKRRCHPGRRTRRSVAARPPGEAIKQATQKTREPIGVRPKNGRNQTPKATKKGEAISQATQKTGRDRAAESVTQKAEEPRRQDTKRTQEPWKQTPNWQASHPNQPSKPTIRPSGHIHSCQPAEASDNRSKWPRNKVPRHQSGKINPFTIPSNFKGWQSIPFQPSNRNNSNIPTIEQVYKTSERPICSTKFAQKCLQRCS